MAEKERDEKENRAVFTMNCNGEGGYDKINIQIFFLLNFPSYFFLVEIGRDEMYYHIYKTVALVRPVPNFDHFQRTSKDCILENCSVFPANAY